MHVFLIAAMTIDGRIARHQDDRSFDWTSIEDKQFYVQKIKAADAIVMGRKSFATFTRYPKGSRWIIYTSQPEAFQNPKPSVIQAEGTNEDPQALLDRLEREGCKTVAICGGSRIYTMFMRAHVVHTVFLTIEPVIFGQGVSLFEDSVDTQLQLIQVHSLTNSVKVLEYRVVGKTEE